jgi:hypothetical protein
LTVELVAPGFEYLERGSVSLEGPLTSHYLVKSLDRKRKDAVVFAEGGEVAGIRRSSSGSTYDMVTSDGTKRWVLDPHVDGEVRPFSISIRRVAPVVTTGPEPDPIELVVRNNLFRYQGRYYMMSGIPEGRSLGEFLLGKKYICRMDSLAFDDIGRVDQGTWTSLRRFRGTVVGELEGTGPTGHQVSLSGELRPIGLLIAAASYVLYSTW